MNPTRGHDQFGVQLWSGFYRTTWASYGQVRGCSHDSFRQAPRRTRDAHLNRQARAGRAERSSRRRRSERRRVPPLAASNGGARPRQPVPVRRRGRISLLWRPPVVGGMWRAGSTERDRVTGVAATTPRQNGDRPDCSKQGAQPCARSAGPTAVACSEVGDDALAYEACDRRIDYRAELTKLKYVSIVNAYEARRGAVAGQRFRTALIAAWAAATERRETT